MIKYETLSRKKMLQEYKKHNLIQKCEKGNYSRTMEMSPFTNQNYLNNITLYRPTSASINAKAHLSKTLKKSNCFRKLLNQSQAHRVDNEEFIRVTEKFSKKYKNKNKIGNQKNFFDSLWEGQKDSNRINGFSHPQSMQIRAKGVNQAQEQRVNSFQEFIQSRKRMQTRKRSHGRTKSQAQNKPIINRHFQIQGRKKEVQVKQRSVDAKRCENSSLEYKQLYKKYLQKLIEQQSQQLRQLRPSSALDSASYTIQGVTIDSKKKSLPTGIHTEQKDERTSKVDKYQQYLLSTCEKRVPTRKSLIEKSKKFSNQLILKHQSFKVKKNIVENQLEGWAKYNDEQLDFLL